MQQKIKILPDNLVNKIAAGEVIQRPASAVKELVENSIDAGAKSVTVIIEDGGKNLIQVVDDGSGMSREDIAISFERHATSKISSYEDIENIKTLGFRGEALASIAAIAQVELVSRMKSADTATRVRINYGTKPEVSPCAGPVGTSAIVRNLFFNTPGRKNFLKSTPTEYKHVVDVFQRMAVSYPETAWILISEGETIFNLRPGSLRERISDVFGERVASSLLPIAEENEFIGLRGMLGRPDFTRKTRAEQYLYLNRRFIVNRTINHAVFKGYENLLLKGAFPIFILFIELNPGSVDVNVHPTKLEVKFEDEGSIYRFVVASVSKVISAGNLIPEARYSETVQTGSPDDKKAHGEEGQNYFRGADFSNSKTDSGKIPPQFDIKNLFDMKSTISTIKSDSVLQNGEKVFSDAFAIQIFNKYILSVGDDGFYLIDQHAAHERILYERAVEKIKTQKIETQELLFPQTIQMPAADCLLVKELLPFLQSLGFSLKLFSSSTIIIDGVPIEIKPGRERTILQEIIDAYKEDEHGTHLEPYDILAKSFACKSAIKAGDPLKENEIQSLIQQLFSCKIPFSCPHGRPVAFKYPLKELDRRFGRTS